MDSFLGTPKGGEFDHWFGEDNQSAWGETEAGGPAPDFQCDNIDNNEKKESGTWQFP